MRSRIEFVDEANSIEEITESHPLIGGEGDWNFRVCAPGIRVSVCSQMGWVCGLRDCFSPTFGEALVTNCNWTASTFQIAIARKRRGS